MSLPASSMGFTSYLAAPWLAHFNLFTPDEQGIVVDKIPTASGEPRVQRQTLR